MIVVKGVAVQKMWIYSHDNCQVISTAVDKRVKNQCSIVFKIKTFLIEYENTMLQKSEVGSGKEHEVFERVYTLKLEEKTNANYEGSQSGGETAFVTGCLKFSLMALAITEYIFPQCRTRYLSGNYRNWICTN